MKPFIFRFLLFIYFLSGCHSAANVDELSASDRLNVINQIIKEEKIRNLDDEFFKIDSTDSTLYYITNYPKDVQKYNKTNPVTDLNKLFDRRDLPELRNQFNTFDTALRLHTIINDKTVHINSISDSSYKDGINYTISYPLLNRDKNALIVFLNYYGGLLCGGEYVLIYVKKSGKWIRLSTILLRMS